MIEMDKLTDVDRAVIEGFAENDMNITRTASALYMHFNNVDYHLRKVERVTGMNPKKFEDLNKLLYEMDWRK